MKNQSLYIFILLFIAAIVLPGLADPNGGASEIQFGPQLHIASIVSHADISLEYNTLAESGSVSNDLPAAVSEVTENPDRKLSGDLQTAMKYLPEEEVGVILTTSIPSQFVPVQYQEYSVSGCGYLCQAIIAYCENATPLLEAAGFHTSAVTGDGHIIGSVKAANLSLLAEDPMILSISGDGGLHDTISEFESDAESLTGNDGLEIINQHTSAQNEYAPGEKVAVAVIYNPETGMETNISSMFCEVSPFVCAYCQMVETVGFEPSAVTLKGFLIGEMKSEDIPKLPPTEMLFVISENYGIEKNVVSMGCSEVPVALQPVPYSRWDPNGPSECELSVGDTCTIRGWNFTTGYEPVRLFGIIPISFLKSNTVRMDLRNREFSETEFIEMDHPTVIRSNGFKIEKSGDTSLKISVTG